MYCPRCGSPNTETTKFCRQCGLAMSAVSGYVATGGTGTLGRDDKEKESLISKATGDLSAKQRLVLTILIFVFSPALVALVDEALGGTGLLTALIPVVAILMPIGIVWAVFKYKAQKRMLEQQTAPEQVYHQPKFEQQPYRPPLQPPGTNPLDAVSREQGSVIEDETRRLPENSK